MSQPPSPTKFQMRNQIPKFQWRNQIMSTKEFFQILHPVKRDSKTIEDSR